MRVLTVLMVFLSLALAGCGQNEEAGAAIEQQTQLGQPVWEDSYKYDPNFVTLECNALRSFMGEFGGNCGSFLLTHKEEVSEQCNEGWRTALRHRMCEGQKEIVVAAIQGCMPELQQFYNYLPLVCRETLATVGIR